MSGIGSRIHLAMGIFYGAERLEEGARALLASASAEHRICVLVNAERLAARPRFAALAVGQPEELGGPLAGVILLHLQQTQPFERQSAADCLSELMDGGGPSRDITRHLEQGGCVLISRTADAALHDQAMRTLLGLSLHTVHSQQFDVPAMQGKDPASARAVMPGPGE
jgi:hypothetical protein